MRILIGAIVLVVLAVGARGAEAQRCKKGKVIYQETRAPLPRESADETPSPYYNLEVRSSGAWTRVEHVNGDPDVAAKGGCLGKRQLAEVKRAIKRASFKLDLTVAVCAAVNTEHVVVVAPGRKKKLSLEQPCGTPPDQPTARMRSCVYAATGGDTGAELRAACRGL